MEKTIAVLAGDGIGPEVMAQALRVLDVVVKVGGYEFTTVAAPIGGAAYDLHGSHCPMETLDICEESDAVLFGSVGGAVDQQNDPKWKNCERESILALRETFSFNTNFRPAKVYSSLQHCCPLRADIVANGIDILVCRELIGGIYFGKHSESRRDDERVAIDDCTYTESQIAVCAHRAFEAASARRKKLVSVDKANVLATSRLWREVVTEVAASYPGVELSHMLVDNCAMQLIVNPGQFDVILTENLFGDILSDTAAVLPGSLGLMPSASLNNQGFGMYEPAGGSAPAIAGKNVANPIAQILSLAMCLRHSFQMERVASMIESAVNETLYGGVHTADIAQNGKKAVGTIEMTDSIISLLSQKALSAV